jgi:hypothetical protein
MEDDRKPLLRKLRELQKAVSQYGICATFKFILVERMIREIQDCGMVAIIFE